VSLVLLLLLLAVVIDVPEALPDPAINDMNGGWGPVEQAMGRNGTLMPGDVMKFSMPRSDLKVMVGNVTVVPGLALGSWAAFKKDSDQSMAMGDLVLLESEVAPVMDRLEQGGVQVTALHNHLMGESPRIMYMHIDGHGDPVSMANTIREALASTGTPIKMPAVAKTSPSGLDTERLDQAIGSKGKWSGNVYQFSVPRADKVTDMGIEIPPSMGVAMPLNFQPTGNGKAAITGDFVLTAEEVNPVIRALRNNGIKVTATHNHMLTEEPRLFFLHFWAEDDADKLALGLRAALNETNSRSARKHE
jgi:biotin operon repressor